MFFKFNNENINKQNEKKRRPVKVGDTEYPSVREAARKLRTSPGTLTIRLKSKEKFKGLNVSYIKK